MKFEECESCRVKAGAILLCLECRSNRDYISTLENAIRKHRDQRGDDRCWMDDEELYKILPEGYISPERDTTVELTNCVKFIQNRQNPNTTYISPEREIERLKARIFRLENERFAPRHPRRRR